MWGGKSTDRTQFPTIPPKPKKHAPLPLLRVVHHHGHRALGLHAEALLREVALPAADQGHLFFCACWLFKGEGELVKYGLSSIDSRR